MGDASISGEEESLIKSSSKLITKFYDENLSGHNFSELLKPKLKFSEESELHEVDRKIVFESLDPGTSYTITVNTIMNGIEIASKEAKIYQMGN